MWRVTARFHISRRIRLGYRSRGGRNFRVHPRRKRATRSAQQTDSSVPQFSEFQFKILQKYFQIFKESILAKKSEGLFKPITAEFPLKFVCIRFMTKVKAKQQPSREYYPESKSDMSPFLSTVSHLSSSVSNLNLTFGLSESPLPLHSSVVAETPSLLAFSSASHASVLTKTLTILSSQSNCKSNLKNSHQFINTINNHRIQKYLSPQRH